MTDIKTKNINIQNENIRLNIIDTYINDSYRSSLRFYYKSANGIIFVYDVCKKESFNNIKKWFDEINIYGNEDCKMFKVLIGNKKDSYDRVISEEEGKQLAKDNNMVYFETSAKNNENVSQVFHFLTNKILRYRQNKDD